MKTSETTDTEENSTEQEAPKGSKNFKDSLSYLKDTFDELKIKELDYVQTLVDTCISEKRARFRLNKKSSGSDSLKPISDSKWQQEQDEQDDYI